MWISIHGTVDILIFLIMRVTQAPLGYIMLMLYASYYFSKISKFMNFEKQEAQRVLNNGLWICSNDLFFFHIKKCLIKLLDLSIESSLFSSNIKCWAFMSMFCWHMNSNKPGRKCATTMIPIGPWDSHCHDGSSHLHTQLHPQGQGTNPGRIRCKKNMASSSPGWGF